MPTQRNPVVRHGAILRKGGAHTQSVSGNRHQSKRQLDDEIDEYFEQLENKSSQVPDQHRDNRTEKGRNNSAPSSFTSPELFLNLQPFMPRSQQPVS